MFTDKTRPQLSTVSTVSRFYTAPGVKTVDTVETVDSSRQFNAKLNRPQIDGYIITMQTPTGVWYLNGRSSHGSVMGWNQDISRSWIYPSVTNVTPCVEAAKAEMQTLFGDNAAIRITHRPIRRTPIGRCEIIEEDRP